MVSEVKWVEIGRRMSVHVDVLSKNVDKNVDVIDPRPTADLRPARPKGSAGCACACACVETDFARNSSCPSADGRSHTSNLSVKP